MKKRHLLFSLIAVSILFLTSCGNNDIDVETVNSTNIANRTEEGSKDNTNTTITPSKSDSSDMTNKGELKDTEIWGPLM